MDDSRTATQTGDVLHTTRNGISATGVYDGEKFEVLEGSEINLTKKCSLERYNQQRQKLQDQNSIAEKDGKYILNITLDFKTPSGASDFVLGGSTNGWVEWKNKDGKTLDEIFRKQKGNSST